MRNSLRFLGAFILGFNICVLYAEESLKSEVIVPTASSSSASTSEIQHEIKTSKYLSRVQAVFTQEGLAINPLKFVCEDLYFSRLEETFENSLLLKEKLLSMKTHPTIRKLFVESAQASHQRPYEASSDKSKLDLAVQSEVQEMLKKVDAAQFECKLAWDLVGGSMEVNLGESQQKTQTAFYRNKAYLVCLIPEGNAIEVPLEKVSDSDADANSLKDALQCYKHSRQLPDANVLLLAIEASLGTEQVDALIPQTIESSL